jgi:hypothetical protein
MVNGAKTYITGGVRADVLVCAVATRPESGHQGISFLLIDRGEGVRRGALSKLGWHASDTAEISLDDVFVPGENLLGTLHGGFHLIMANFQSERLLMALGAVGAMHWRTSPPRSRPGARSPMPRCAVTWPGRMPCARSRSPSCAPSWGSTLRRSWSAPCATPDWARSAAAPTRS